VIDILGTAFEELNWRETVRRMSKSLTRARGNGDLPDPAELLLDSTAIVGLGRKCIRVFTVISL
jgi:hypothetical protein